MIESRLTTTAVRVAALALAVTTGTASTAARAMTRTATMQVSATVLPPPASCRVNQVARSVSCDGGPTHTIGPSTPTPGEATTTTDGITRITVTY